MNKKHLRPKGFIALLTVMCMSLMLLSLTAALGLAGWSTRFQVLAHERKTQSIILAHGCLDIALAHVVAEAAYSGNATTSGSNGTCYTFPIEGGVPHLSRLTLKVRARVADVATSLVAEYNLHDIEIDATPETGASNGSENVSITLEEWHEVP